MTIYPLQTRERKSSVRTMSLQRVAGVVKNISSLFLNRLKKILVCLNCCRKLTDNVTIEYLSKVCRELEAIGIMKKYISLDGFLDNTQMAPDH